MDVLTGDAMEIEHDGDQDCLVRLIEHLGSQRARHVGKLRRVVDDVGTRVRGDLKRASRQVEKLFKQAPGDFPQSAAIAKTVARAIELGTELKVPARLSRRNLHKYRLKVKELKEVLQLAEQSDTHKFIDDLRRVKDAIGEWHDWMELCTIATGLLDHASCVVRKDLVASRDTKFDEALRLTEQLRATYAKTGAAQRGTRSRTKPGLSFPLLKAASAITRHS